MTTRKLLDAALVAVAVWCGACGYSELEMQAQRDQITGLRSAVVDLSESAVTYQTTIAKLTADNERLQQQCPITHE